MHSTCAEIAPLIGLMTTTLERLIMSEDSSFAHVLRSIIVAVIFKVGIGFAMILILVNSEHYKRDEATHHYAVNGTVGSKRERRRWDKLEGRNFRERARGKGSGRDQCAHIAFWFYLLGKRCSGSKHVCAWRS